MEKKIYPKYDLGQDDFKLGLMSYVRKKNEKDGKWYLIPVVLRWDKGDNFNTDTLVQVLDLFHDKCYRVLVMWKFPEPGTLLDVHGRPIGGEIDPIQIEESDRLNIEYRRKIKLDE